MSKKIICLDAGHGGKQPGNVYGARLEKDDTLKLTLLVGAELAKQGITIVYTRTTDVDVSINNRCKIANDAKADYFLSIHRNGATTQATGNEIWVLKTATDATAEKAKKILTACCSVYGSNRGVKYGAPNYNNFGINSGSKMPSALLEVGFLNNPTDNKNFDTLIQKYAVEIAKALCEIVGIKYTIAPASGPAVSAPKFAVGDRVKIIGNYASSANGQVSYSLLKGYYRYITKIYAGTKNPYRLGSIQGNLSAIFTTGFAPETSITK